MKHLFIVRHGSYEPVPDGMINDNGIRQMLTLAPYIKEFVKGKYQVLTSTALRAKFSARTLMTELGSYVIYEEIPYLWTGRDSHEENYDVDYTTNPDKNEKLLKIIESRGKDVDSLVLITHLEVLDEFPDFYMSNLFGKHFDITRINRGEALHIDLENKTYERLPK